MILHTELEWELMLAAYIYESKPDEVCFMSDQTFDLLSNMNTNSTIPGFDPNTGQWVTQLSQDYINILKEALSILIRKYPDKQEGTAIKHLIDSKYISNLS
jgi:hypothetical protein